MNMFEEFLARVAPSWAVSRARNRYILDQVRAYEAAKPNRSNEGWIKPGTSANAEVGPALNRLRNSSRDLVRNNPIAASAIQNAAAHMVGKGIVPRLHRTVSNAEQCNDRWETFVEYADPEGLTTFYGMQALLARTVAESGEALIRWYDRPPSRDFPSPLQCEILEPDFIDTARTEERSNGNYVIQGVEYDRRGRRVAYWLFDQHPGETSIARFRSYISRRVDARYISPVFQRWRPGQARGIPWMAPATIRVKDLDDYEFAERMSKKIAACFSVFVQKTDGLPLGSTEKDTETGKRREKVSPGTITYLKQGEKAVFGEPKSSDGYADYMIMQLHLIAAGAGQPYHMITGDLRQANYSSLREGKLLFYALVDQWQDHMLMPMSCTPAWNRVQMSSARLDGGDLPSKKPLWQRPARPWVDPQKETFAENLQMENGTKSWVQAILERGLEPEQVLEEMERYHERLTALGIDLFSSYPSSANNALAEAAVKDSENEEQQEASKAEEQAQ